MSTPLYLIPKLSRDIRLSLTLAAASLAMYMGNFKTLGSGDTVPASLLPIVLLTEGRIFVNSYEQHYKDTWGGPVYFFADTKRGTVSNYPPATGLIATPSKSIFEEGRPKPGAFVFFMLFAWSGATQLLGAYAPTDWNVSPQSIGQAPARLWDWWDNPMSRSLRLVENKLWGLGQQLQASPNETRSATGDAVGDRLGPSNPMKRVPRR